MSSTSDDKPSWWSDDADYWMNKDLEELPFDAPARRPARASAAPEPGTVSQTTAAARVDDDDDVSFAELAQARRAGVIPQQQAARPRRARAERIVIDQPQDKPVKHTRDPDYAWRFAGSWRAFWNNLGAVLRWCVPLALVVLVVVGLLTKSWPLAAGLAVLPLLVGAWWMAKVIRAARAHNRGEGIGPPGQWSRWH